MHQHPIRLERNEDSAVIVWKWMDPTVFILIPFAFICNYVGYHSFLQWKESETLHPIAFTGLFGIFLIYAIITSLLNSTYIIFKGDTIKKETRPIPSFTDGIFKKSEIASIDNFLLPNRKSNKWKFCRLFSIYIILKSGKRVRLLSLEQDSVKYCFELFENSKEFCEVELQDNMDNFKLLPLRIFS